jgi:hypothetical protein
MNAALQRSRISSHVSVCGALLLALAAYACPVALRAQEIYQSVDAQGHVVFSDRPPPGAEPHTVVPDGSQSPPQVLHFCWTNCFTLKADHGIYSRTDGTDETWTVESFSPNSFVLHRHDAPAAWNRFKAEVTYAGQVANDRLINVTVDGWPTDGIQAAWGSALNTLPGSNAERDRLDAGGPASQAGDVTPDGSATPEVTANEEPPPLPDEEQPACDAEGSVWTPGYWGWNATAYYWVRGAWMRPPRVGVLWTPGYWAFAGGVFVFHPGYWGPRVGYYGGIDYGYGYFGSGYSGGRWIGTRFAYNTAVSNVNMRVVRNTYREPAPASLAASRVSYQRLPSRTTTISIPRDHVAPPQPHFAPAPRPTQRVRQVAPRVAPTPAVAAEPKARNATPSHTTVAAPRTLARTPSRGILHPKPGAPAAE